MKVPRQRLVTLAFSVVGVSVMGVSGLIAATKTDVTRPATAGRDGTPDDVAEANASRLATASEEAGSLGFGVDASGSYVALLPLDRPLPTIPGVRTQHAAFTKVSLDSTLAMLRSKATSSRNNYAFGVDAASGKLVVRSNGPESEIAEVISKFPGVIKFEPTPALGPRSRNADTIPHYGGSLIDAPGGGCSSGPMVVRPDGTRYAVTAAHCWGIGAVVNSGGNPYGSVVNRAWPTWDQEIVGGSVYGFRIWYGTATTFTTVNQVGAGNPSVGLSYCTSGRSGTICGHVVTNTNVTTCYSGQCFPGTIQATVDVPSGDSGGTFHTVSGSSAGVRGMVTSGDGSYVYIEPWSRIASRWNVTIATN